MLSSKSIVRDCWLAAITVCLVALLVRFLPHLLLAVHGHYLVTVTGGRPYWGFLKVGTRQQCAGSAVRVLKKCALLQYCNPITVLQTACTFLHAHAE